MTAKLSFYRLMHISDIHIHAIPKNPLTCFNKRFKGVLRQLFLPLGFKTKRIQQYLPDIAQDLNVHGICISGDLTFTSWRQEFATAKQFVEQLHQRVHEVFCLPGNHDVYTVESMKYKTFYQYFPNQQLETNGVSFHALTPRWWLVLMDCSRENGWLEARGTVRSSQLSVIEAFLAALPAENHVIIANHYPLLNTSKSYRHLLHAEQLQELLNKFSQVKLYLHGHDHQASLYRCRDSHPQIILNSGSVSHKQNGRFNILDLYDDRFLIQTLAIANLESNDSSLILQQENTIEEFV